MIKLPVRCRKNFSEKRFYYEDEPFTKETSSINTYYTFRSHNKILRAKLLEWISDEECKVLVYDSDFNDKSNSEIVIKPSDFDYIYELGLSIFDFNQKYYAVYIKHENAFIGKLTNNSYLPAYDFYDPAYLGNQATVWRVKADADYYAKRYHGEVIEVSLMR